MLDTRSTCKLESKESEAELHKQSNYAMQRISRSYKLASNTQLIEKYKEDIEKENLLEKELLNVEKIKKAEFGIIDESASSSYFIKLQIECFISFVLYFIVLYTSILFYVNSKGDNKQTNIFSEVDNQTVLLSIITIFNSICIYSTITCYIIQLKYEKSKYDISKNSTIFSTGNYKYLFIEILFILFSPNIYFDAITVTASKKFNNYELMFPLNFVLFPFIFIRLYKPLKLVLFVTRYFDFRAGRISSMMGLKLNFIFAVKCLLCKRPTTIILFMLSMSTLSFSLLMNIYEGPVFEQLRLEYSSSTNSYESYYNCLWFIIVTTTTIGFGDYYPVTNIARIVTVMAAIVGNICLSILTYTTLCYFTISEPEQKLIKFITRLESKSKLDHISAKFLKSSVKYLFARNALIKFLKENQIDLDCKDDKMSKIHFSSIEFKSVRAKYYDALYTKIAAKREFKKIYHKFRNKYEFYEIDDEINLKLAEIDRKLENLSRLMDKGKDLRHHVRIGSKNSQSIESLKRVMRIEQRKVIESVKKRKRKDYKSNGSSISTLINLVMFDAENVQNYKRSSLNYYSDKKREPLEVKEMSFLENSQELLSYIQSVKNEEELGDPLFHGEIETQGSIKRCLSLTKSKTSEIQKPENDQQLDIQIFNSGILN